MRRDVPQKPVQLTSRDKRLIEHLAQKFPVVARPFEALERLGLLDDLAHLFLDARKVLLAQRRRPGGAAGHG